MKSPAAASAGADRPVGRARKREERAAAIKRRGRQQTILTSPLGDTGDAQTKSATLGGV